MKNLLLVGQFSDTDFDWQELLSGSGWTVDVIHSEEDLGEKRQNRYKVIVFRVERVGKDGIFDILKDFDEYDCTGFLPVLYKPRAETVVDLMRRGVTDVLINPVSKVELLEAIARVEKRQSILSDNLSYNRKLEQANKELTESLKILKMDQIAGREAQKSLLPPQPISFKGFTVTHTIIPSLYLSGDFVAYQLTFDRYILFFLADVSGHGASSAFVTILLRFILKQIIRRHIREDDMVALSKAPEGFMEHVNRQLMATGIEKQVTMFGGAINTDTNIMRYAVAAQMPMPLFIADGDARFLPGKGKILGLFEDAYWEIHEIALPDRFRMVMVSDGLLETLPGTSLQEQESFLVEALSESHADHQSMCRALGLDELTDVADDVSILSISRGEVC